MTSKADFTAEEWKLILEAPPSAGMIVVTAQRGGSFRETIAMAKAYVEARKQHGNSQLLDDIVAAKPERDHEHAHFPEELEQHGLQHLRDSVSLLQSKATPEEVDEYRRFIVTLSQHVAAAHREHGQDGERGRAGGDRRHHGSAQRARRIDALAGGPAPRVFRGAPRSGWSHRPGPRATVTGTFRPWTRNVSDRLTSTGSTKRSCPGSSCGAAPSSPRPTLR